MKTTTIFYTIKFLLFVFSPQLLFAFDLNELNSITNRPGSSSEIEQTVISAIQVSRQRIAQNQEEFNRWAARRRTNFNQNFLNGNKSHLIATPQELFEERLSLIQNARESIYLTTFAFTVDSSAREITRALCQKGREGLDIRLLIDYVGSFRFFRDRVDRELLEGCSVKVLPYNTTLWGLDSLFYATHEKLLLIDGKTLLIGGNGIGNDYHHIQPMTATFFYDLELKLEGPIVCDYQRRFEQTYFQTIEYSENNKTVGSRLNNDRLEYFFGITPFKPCSMNDIKGSEQFFGVYSNPLFSDERPIVERYIDAILNLRRGDHLKIYSPYFVPTERYINALLWARSQGIEVTVITNSIESMDVGIAILVGMVLTVSDLQKAGVKIMLWNGGPNLGLHRKATIFGNKYFAVGSDNLDRRGHNYSSETMVFSRTRSLINEVSAQFDHDISRSREYDLAYKRRILNTATPFIKRLVENYILELL
jgi:cardiolipin synthase